MTNATSAANATPSVGLAQISFTDEGKEAIRALLNGFGQQFSPELAVRQFHRAFGHPVEPKPVKISLEEAKLGFGLIAEEYQELYDALFGGLKFGDDATPLEVSELKDEQREAGEEEGFGDIVEVADAIGDLIWVLFGLAARIGITATPIIETIARSNMSKLGADGLPIYAQEGNPDGYPVGKILKGPNYEPPTEAIKAELRAQGWDGSFHVGE